jgi:hypothetical protein
MEIFDSFLEECRSQIEKIDKRKIVVVDKAVLLVGRRGIGVVLIFVFIEDLMERIFGLRLDRRNQL